MTDLEKVQFRNEGEPATFTDPEENNSAASPAEKNTTETDPAAGGKDNTGKKKDEELPFHEHPRWKDRESEWETRFNSQETRHQEDMKAIRDELQGGRSSTEGDKVYESKPMPSWFGGSKEQWVAYQKDRDAELSAIAEKARTSAVSEVSEKEAQQAKLVEEATAYMKSEMAAIESDKTLNPDGLKVDPNRLLKVVLDENLVDTTGRWNYKAGWKLLRVELAKDKKPTGDRTKIAAATNSSDTKPAETQPKNFKTAADFKKARPW